VIEYLPSKPSHKEKPSQQFVRRFLEANKNTRLGGYALVQLKDEGLTRPLAYYKLVKTDGRHD
jgi:hypothetical protein